MSGTDSGFSQLWQGRGILWLVACSASDEGADSCGDRRAGGGGTPCRADRLTAAYTTIRGFQAGMACLSTLPLFIWSVETVQTKWHHTSRVLMLIVRAMERVGEKSTVRQTD